MKKVHAFDDDDDDDDDDDELMMSVSVLDVVGS